MTRAFIHGLESSSQGTKGHYFRVNYPDMIIEDYSGSLTERMEKMESILDGKTDLILVGSSYGGLMAAIYACKHPDSVRRLILLAPALDLPAFKPYLTNRLSVSTVLYHGNHDDVVQPDRVREIANKIFTDLRYCLVDDDHPLTSTFTTLDWNDLLKEI